jgi:outer membrane protein TolC
VLTAQRTYFQVNLAYLAALREAWQAAIEIDALLLSDGLREAK